MSISPTNNLNFNNVIPILGVKNNSIFEPEFFLLHETLPG
jgi:hypothetical protein